MSLLPVFPWLENLLGACLSHECVGSFLALFSCLNFNFLSAWAQFWELKHIEPCPRGGKAPNSSSALSFVLAWELSASWTQEQWQCLRINLLSFFLLPQLWDSCYSPFYFRRQITESGWWQRLSMFCVKFCGVSWEADSLHLPSPGCSEQEHQPVLWAGWAHTAAESERS